MHIFFLCAYKEFVLVFYGMIEVPKRFEQKLIN